MRKFLIWSTAVVNIGHIIWRGLIVSDSLHSIRHDAGNAAKGMTAGIAATNVSMALEEGILATSLIRLALGHDPFPLWLLWLRFAIAALISVPSITYLMGQMGYFERLGNWLNRNSEPTE